MKNYNWAKGYKYTKVPIHYWRLELFGFSFILQSHATKRRRTGALITKPEIWNKYTELLTLTNI